MFCEISEQLSEPEFVTSSKESSDDTSGKSTVVGEGAGKSSALLVEALLCFISRVPENASGV